MGFHFDRNYFIVAQVIASDDREAGRMNCIQNYYQRNKSIRLIISRGTICLVVRIIVLSALTTFPQCDSIFHWNFQKYSISILYAIID